MGWLGWIPEVALRTDVNLIEMALRGRLDLLATVGLIKMPETARLGSNTSNEWQAYKNRHNLRYQQQEREKRRERRRRERA